MTGTVADAVSSDTPGAEGAFGEVAIFPLSFAQQRLWFLDQLAPGSPVYNIRDQLSFDGPLDVSALELALNALVARHEALRTTFSSVDGEAVQVVAEELELLLPLTDLTALEPAERNEALTRLSDAEARHPFDLTQGPLLRAVLVRMTPEHHELLVTIHHIVSDGWSMEVFARELRALYTATACGADSLLPELPIQYADYAVWQREQLSGPVLEQQLGYWTHHLAGAPVVLELPTDRPRPPTPSYRGGTYHFALPRELSRALADMAQAEGATLFMTLFAGFASLLHRYSGQSDLLVGTPVAGRTHAELEGLIGFFVNTLVLRARFHETLTFRDLLAQVRQTAIEAYAHQDLPFERLVEELRPERGASYHPLFQVMFQLQHAADSGSGGDLPRHVQEGTAKFDLSLSIITRGEHLEAAFEYSADLFHDDTIRRMAGHLEVLLATATGEPDRRACDLPLLTEAERRQILIEWNDTDVEYPLDQGIHHLIEAQTDRTPDAVAVIYEGQQLTYRELDNRANQLAHHLISQGIGPETLVAVCADRSLELVVGLVAILKAGGAYVPLDPSYPRDRIAFMLADAAAPVLLTQSHLRSTLPPFDGLVLELDTDAPVIANNCSTKRLEHAVTGDRLAYVIYTSGSTGRPKGVMIEHAALTNHMLWICDSTHLSASDRVLQRTSFSFDAAAWELLGTLTAGGTLELAPADHQTDVQAQFATALRDGITVMQLVPTALRSLLASNAFRQARSFNKIYCGGEALSPDLQREFFSQSSATLYNLYGPTEAAIDVTWWRCEREPSTSIVPIGRPIANTRIYLLDAYGQPVPVGVSGELYVGGAGLARGYLNRPELTAERFVPDPFSDDPQARLYRTGDLARYLPDGNIEYLGRIDHQVKIRGFRIELGEIEAVLAEHPALRESVVLAREDVPGEKRLVAYLVAMPGARLPSTTELRHHLGTRLPDYMLPSAFVWLEVLPLTPNGKVDRRALPPPDQERPDLDDTYVAPRTPEEAALAEIWRAVLGLERVGVHDNFFELGGHSLLATQVAARLRAARKIELPLRLIFEHPTIAEIALCLNDTHRSSNLIKRTSREGRRAMKTRDGTLLRLPLNVALGLGPTDRVSADVSTFAN